jgi:hypothetical protein
LFRIVGPDDRGAIVLRQKWSRNQVEVRLANMPPCLIGMEPCVSANALGQDARLMSARADVGEVCAPLFQKVKRTASATLGNLAPAG